MSLDNLRKYLSVVLIILSFTGQAMFLACKDDPIGPVITESGQNEGDEDDSTD
ncbi:hypothetical protein MJD09_20755 [bacterium]|nr:hypothetical protein [bacterium]